MKTRYGYTPDEKIQRHTPTPWSLNSGYNKAGAPFFEIKDKDGFNLLAIRGGVIPISQDADFIVRAVNSHEAMLKALKEAQKVIAAQNNGNMLVSIEDAIAQAEGK